MICEDVLYLFLCDCQATGSLTVLPIQNFSTCVLFSPAYNNVVLTGLQAFIDSVLGALPDFVNSLSEGL